MALAPSLLTFLNISVGVGSAVLSGLAVTAETGQRSPARATPTIAGNAPTITVQLGPTADPDVGAVSAVGQIPFLQRMLVIAPGLPDSAPEQNDLTPTLVWQDTPTPGVGSAIMQGRAPAVIGDTGQNIGVEVGSAIINGLAPTLSVPAGQTGTTEPIIGAAAFTALEPTLYLELTQTVTDNQSEGILTVTGLAPELSVRVGWTDVPPATGGWTAIPRV